MASKAQVKKFNGNYFLNIQNFLPEEVMGGLLESCDELITKIKKDPTIEVFPPEATSNILNEIKSSYQRRYLNYTPTRYNSIGQE